MKNEKLNLKTKVSNKELDLQDILKMRAGDKQAFGRMYMRHRGFIAHNYGLKLGYENIELIEDMVADLFAKVFEKMDMFDEKTFAFSTWLTNVANNFLIDHIRVMGRRGRVVSIEKSAGTIEDGHMSGSLSFGSSEEELGNEDGMDPEKELVDLEFRNLILNLVNENLKTKSGIMLSVYKKKFYEGLSYAEIMKDLNISLPQVKTHIFRGNKIMEAVLLENDISLKKVKGEEKKGLRKSGSLKRGEVVDGVVSLYVVKDIEIKEDDGQDEEF